VNFNSIFTYVKTLTFILWKFSPGLKVGNLFQIAQSRIAMKLPIFTVDAFAEEPFVGNPAAVVPLQENLNESTMQKIAFEMNISETAFVTAVPGSDSPFQNNSRFGLRWFTPTNEVPLCGHATLAAAHTLFYILENASSSLEFETLSGTLIARKQDGGIILDFPSNRPNYLSDSEREKYSPLIKAVVGELKMKEVLLSPTTKKLLIRLDNSHSRTDLELLQPTKEQLLALNDGTEVRGVIVSLEGDLHRGRDDSRGLHKHHFASRYFAPWVGIDEDPVTGSAHTVLAPYWSNQPARSRGIEMSTMLPSRRRTGP
ncbi:UNVERIFIED_CONTAM: hypothetical protein GTU68_041206, partial [Idotea baltica]|nr:hypothetical protein [Idotea baltica]